MKKEPCKPSARIHSRIVFAVSLEWSSLFVLLIGSAVAWYWQNGGTCLMVSDEGGAHSYGVDRVVLIESYGVDRVVLIESNGVDRVPCWE